QAGLRAYLPVLTLLTRQLNAPLPKSRSRPSKSRKSAMKPSSSNAAHTNLSRDEFEATCILALRGDQQALGELRTLLDRHPGIPARLGDLSRLLQWQLV